MLPISVMLPTRNSMALLPAHLGAMRAWLDLAQEVVIVDSASTDGTIELLQRELMHSDARFLSHPPGLYHSWNFGIAQCRAPYVYISTVGEQITRDGLGALVSAAESLQADVVISPPRMVYVDGRTRSKVWPIHALLEATRPAGPVAFEGAAAQLFAVAYVLRGILGSSASNLYRTDVLRRFPFRVDFGTAGDLAWGLEHAARLRMAVVPQSVSTFVFHPKSYAKSDYAVVDFNGKCLALARAAIQPMKGGPPPGDSGIEALSEQLIEAWARFLDEKKTLADAKRSALWWLSPAAWRQHWCRAAAARALADLQGAALRRVGRSFIPRKSPTR